MPSPVTPSTHRVMGGVTMLQLRMKPRGAAGCPDPSDPREPGAPDSHRLDVNDILDILEDEEQGGIGPTFLPPEEKEGFSNCAPYYGRHSTKQLIRGKPILWVLSGLETYMFRAEPYWGSSIKLPVTALGQGGDVVLGLVKSGKKRAVQCLYFDNFFTSFPLLNEPQTVVLLELVL